MIKILLHGFFDPSSDLSPRTVSALALRALADTVYSGWDQGWDQKSRVIIYIYIVNQPFLLNQKYHVYTVSYKRR